MQMPERVYFSREHAVKFGVEISVWIWYCKEYDIKMFDSRDIEFLMPFLSNHQIRNLIDKMKEFHLLNEFNFQEEVAVNLLKSKSPSIFNGHEGKFSLCEWCNSQTLLLHKHHYPKRKKDGGKDVVKICANCHQEFHYMCDYKKYFMKEIDERGELC